MPGAVELGPDLGVAEVESAVVGKAVAALGDGQRQRLHACIGNDILGPFRVPGPVEERLVRADQTERGGAVGIVGLDRIRTVAIPQAREVGGTGRDEG